MRTRFAPSPSGFLHLGNIRTALFNWLAAQASGGEMCLRIEDTDQTRSSDAHIAAIVDDLAWLGLTWQGNNGVPLRQSQQTAIHRQALAHLLKSGAAYPCFCTPDELQKARENQRRNNQPPRYSGTCANLSAAETSARLAQLLQNAESVTSTSTNTSTKNDSVEIAEQTLAAAVAVRFRMPADSIIVHDLVRGEVRFIGADIGDFIVRRTDGAYAFFFANAIDDAAGNITHVLRGEDHLSNTPRQLALLAALEMPAPQYGHLPLLTAPNGGPLSKRDGAQSATDLRDRGILPQALLNYLSRVGLTLPDDDPHTLPEIAQLFSYAGLSSAPAAFDMQQLLHRQKQAIQKLSPQQLADWLAPVLPAMNDGEPNKNMNLYCNIARENAIFPEDVGNWRRIAEDDSIEYSIAALETITAAASDFYAAAAAVLEPMLEANDTDNAQWTAFQKATAASTNCRGRALFMPLRAAWTGRLDGPDMPTIFQLLGCRTAHRRLLQAKNIIDSATQKT